MKLIEIVKRIEAAGLTAGLHVGKSDMIHLWCTTERPSYERSWPPSVLFAVPIEGDGTPTCWSDDRIIADIEKASKHPEAVARREGIERFEACAGKSANAAA